MKTLINKITTTDIGLNTLPLRFAAGTISVALVFRGTGNLSADRLLHTQLAK
ncbi:MAG: hypothetical protein ACI82Z_000187 [Cellvibrionaceae bacterium]